MVSRIDGIATQYRQFFPLSGDQKQNFPYKFTL
jgi:hypothetical protein